MKMFPVWISLYRRRRQAWASFIVIVVESNLLSSWSSPSSSNFCLRRVRASVTIDVASAIDECFNLRQAMVSRGENDGARATEGDNDQFLHVNVHHDEQLLQYQWQRATTVMVNPKP